MESLRKFLKNNKNVEIFLTTENNTYEGKGKDILKEITKDEFDEIDTSNKLTHTFFSRYFFVGKI